MLQDLRFACRLIARERWVSAAAIVALALGIGVNAIGFTIVNAAFFRGLPFEDSHRLHVLSWLNRAGRRSDVSFPEFEEWRAGSQSFAGLAAYTDAAMNLSDDRTLPEEARGALVTANTFAMLRQQPLLGRDFAPGDERPGAEPVVIIGDTLWKSRYASDPNVLRRTLRVNGRPASIVGVMPPTMKFPDNTEIWVPFVPIGDRESRTARSLTVFGRLRNEIGLREAQAEMNALARQASAASPDLYTDLVGVRVETFAEAFVGGLGRRLFLLIMVSVGLVLLIACANVANLLLSRSAYRAREIAVRMTVGATRWRVIRQLLIESLVLGFLGGASGLVVATVGVQQFDAGMQDTGLPYWIVFDVDYVVFAYVATICAVTAVLCGLSPALHVSKANNHDVLKEGGRGATGNRRVRRMSGALIVSQLALTIVLLGGGGLLLRSFLTLYSVDIGIDLDHLMAMNLRLPAAKYPTADARRAFFDQLEPRLAAIPGITSAAITTGVPGRDGGERLLEVARAGRTGDDRPQFVSTVTITPRFFDVVDRPMLRGRGFLDSDGSSGNDAVIIDERLSARFFPGEDPIGRRVRFVARDTSERAGGLSPGPWFSVVGVVASIPHGSPQDAYKSVVVYIPYRRDAPGNASLLLESALSPAVVMDAVRREVQALDQDQPVFTIQTLRQLLAGDRWPYRVFGSLFAILAAIALVLSTVGLYSVMAYSVSQRTQEIGVRMAVGARRHHVSWLILKRGLVQLAVGLPLGLAGALAVGVVLERMLVDVSPGDPTTFIAVTMLLAVVSILACLVPTRRATRIDPMVALRCE